MTRKNRNILIALNVVGITVVLIVGTIVFKSNWKTIHILPQPIEVEGTISRINTNPATRSIVFELEGNATTWDVTVDDNSFALFLLQVGDKVKFDHKKNSTTVSHLEDLRKKSANNAATIVNGQQTKMVHQAALTRVAFVPNKPANNSLNSTDPHTIVFEIEAVPNRTFVAKIKDQPHMQLLRPGDIVHFIYWKDKPEVEYFENIRPE